MRKTIYCPQFLTHTEFDWIRNVTPVDSAEKADIIVFSGGADINPALYGCAKHSSTYYNEIRDKLEVSCFKHLKPHQIVIGICRGAQLITALNGGKLIQNVTGHCSGPHYITNGDLKFKIESIHHQMMYPFDMSKSDYDILFWSSKKQSTVYEGDGIETPPCEPEVILYHKEGLPKCLAIQGHPEMMFHCQAHEVFNDILKNII